jgi:hypothetical protein
MDLDPRLEVQLREAGESGEVEAVFFVAQSDYPTRDERGPAGPLLDRVTEQVHETPTKLRFMPKLGAFVVRGSGRLIRRLLDQTEVVTASANLT